MSLVILANVCSHLQNASKARLGITSIPSTNATLALALALQNSGFLSSVIRGGPEPPLMLTSTSHPHATNEHHEAEATVTQENIASRRLWLGLKYWNQFPVLERIHMESKPKKRIMLELKELEAVVRGHEREHIKGIRSPGECLYLKTRIGTLEAREAVERRTGGIVLCRAQ